MLSLISKSDLENLNKTSLIDYDRYLKWLDDEENADSSYHIISTSNVDIREKSEWDEKGREIYDPEKLRIHVAVISNIMTKLGLKVFAAQHEYLPAIWFNKNMLELGLNSNILNNKINFIKSFVPDYDPFTFNGGFLLDGVLFDFMKEFADYPFVLKYRNIDILSLEKDIVIKIGHHLNIDFVTLNIDYLDKIDSSCKANNILAVRGREENANGA